MGKYTDTVAYIDPPGWLVEGGPMRFATPPGIPSRVGDRSPVYSRARDEFSQAEYAFPAPPLYLGQMDIGIGTAGEPLYVLRLLVKEPGRDFVLPAPLGMLRTFIEHCAAYQAAWFPRYHERFAYLTVRSGEVMSTSDDVLHVDGFQGTETPRHVPDQNYFWADSYPTVFSMQPFFVERLNPGVHNVHEWFQARAEPSALYSGVERGVYMADAYHVHMRPQVPAGTRRSFVRMSFIAGEIRDDTSTVNPWLRRGPYGRGDVRDRLVEYQGPSGEDVHGLTHTGRRCPAPPDREAV